MNSSLQPTDNQFSRAVSLSCPICNSSYLDRIERRWIDRMLGLFVPIRRFYCSSCGWKGNLKVNRD